jgi:hypothetical protein
MLPNGIHYRGHSLRHLSRSSFKQIAARRPNSIVYSPATHEQGRECSAQE